MKEMSIVIKTGSLTEFFESARETAREIDQHKPITPKNTIWVEPADLVSLLKPERTDLLRYLRGKQQVDIYDLATEMKRSINSMKRDLMLLSKYQLVQVLSEKRSGHNKTHKIVQPTFGKQMIEFIAKI